jgi:hypothetical protein
MDPIQIVPQGTITISATTSSAATALPTVGLNGVRQLEISNAGTGAVFVETGTSSAITAAVASGYPVLPSQCKVITINAAVTHIAMITGSGTQTVYVSVGVGE